VASQPEFWKPGNWKRAKARRNPQKHGQLELDDLGSIRRRRRRQQHQQWPECIDDCARADRNVECDFCTNQREAGAAERQRDHQQQCHEFTDGDNGERDSRFPNIELVGRGELTWCGELAGSGAFGVFELGSEHFFGRGWIQRVSRNIAECGVRKTRQLRGRAELYRCNSTVGANIHLCGDGGGLGRRRKCLFGIGNSGNPVIHASERDLEGQKGPYRFPS